MTGAWDGDLVRHGEALSAARARYVESLAAVAATTARRCWEWSWNSAIGRAGCAGLGLGEALAQSWGPDQEAGATQVGPHRAELAIRLDGLSVKDRISRGQQKLLAAALLMAQVKLFPETRQCGPAFCWMIRPPSWTITG